MRIAVEIDDALLLAAQTVATREGVTLGMLVERGLRRVVDEGVAARTFTLRRASFKGHGLRSELRDAGWDALRALAYEGRGG